MRPPHPGLDETRGSFLAPLPLPQMASRHSCWSRGPEIGEDPELG
ncbi:MAG: hypothetical protein ACJ71W_00210 [Terriglobales bacterium]